MVIDINGEQGNVFYIIGQCKRIASKTGMDFEPIKKDMMSGNYDHVLDIVEEKFSEHITLIGR